MRVTLKGHESFYGVGDIVRLFFDEPKENREEGFVECQGCDELEIVSQVGDRIVKSFVTNSDDLRYRDLSVERNINEDGIPSKREVKRQKIKKRKAKRSKKTEKIQKGKSKKIVKNKVCIFLL